MAAYYTVEIALKCYICHRNNYTKLPKAFQTHDLTELLNASGLYGIATEDVSDPRSLSGGCYFAMPDVPRPHENWKIVLAVTEQDVTRLRYQAPSQITQKDAERYINAVTLAPYGVLLWLTSRA
jgi:hypothetical protein